MEKQDCLEIGRITKTIGYKGSVILNITPGLAECIENEGSVFIEINEELVPFFIEEIQESDEESLVLKFEAMQDLEQARTYIGRTVYLPVDRIPATIRQDLREMDVEDYDVIDERLGMIGKAGGLMHLPGHSVLRVRKGKTEILIPWVADIIVEINHSKKLIRLRAPEGLIEAYLK